MINKYKKVSIIYGTRGRDCACAIQELFSKKHADDIFPIKSHLLAKEYLSNNNILTTIRDIISSSDICIILLTFDDIDNTRIRQNILVEIGMAAVLLAPSQIYFFSEKIPLPEDFPSDLRHSINPNFFNPEDPEQTAKKIAETIIKEVNIGSYTNLLTDDRYIYDYLSIISDVPSSIYELEAETQMQRILNEWEETIKSFDYAAERITYILERCVFFTLFRQNETLSDFLSMVYREIRPTESDYRVFDPQLINSASNIADNIVKYTDLAYQQAQEAKSLNVSNVMKRRWYLSFASIADELESMSEKILSKELPLNWYLATMAYDYSGLARMRAVRYGQLSQSIYEAELKKALSMFENANTLIRRHCFHSRYLWEGYTQYNISRIFELLYERNKSEEYMQCIRDASAAAIKARRKIVDSSIHLKGIFSIALTYEYFHALYHEYDLEFKWPEFSEGDLNDMAERINAALAELNLFCDSTGLRQLYDMRDDLQSLLSKTKE